MHEYTFKSLTIGLCIGLSVSEQRADEAICSFVELYSHGY